MAHEHVAAGIASALKVCALTSDVVVVEARKAVLADPQPAAGPDGRPVGHPVGIPEDIVSMTRRRLATLPVDSWPMPRTIGPSASAGSAGDGEIPPGHATAKMSAGTTAFAFVAPTH